MNVIILAGGKGTRLKPYTVSIPKPLVPVGDHPILEIVIKRLKTQGFRDIILSVNHMSELIRSYFGSGKKLGVNIKYSLEASPLGTAGPLALVRNAGDNFIVMNGDLLTDLDFTRLVKYHKAFGQISTLVSYKKKVSVDLGTLELDRDRTVKKYVEKPVLEYNASAGIYVFNRKALSYIEKGRRMDLPGLIMRLLKEGETVKAYDHNGLWFDIGTPSDYEEAVNIFNKNKKLFL